MSILDTLITGGIFGLVQFLITRKDKKDEKRDDVKAQLELHGTQLDTLTELIKAEGQKQDEIRKKLDEQGEALAGLEHTQIVEQGTKHLREGITVQEYDDMMKYLYAPYRNLGGNGTAELIMTKLREIVEE